MNSGAIRRLILTLATGYLTVFGIRHIPYEFQKEWLVLIPALILVYALTVWIEGKIFKEDEITAPKSKNLAKKKTKVPNKGFGT